MSITAHGLTKRLGEFELVDVSVTIEEGEYFVLLGPTGAGKTIFVECIAGIHTPDRGSVSIDDRDVTPLRPEERGIGYVPQDYALFPHLTVAQNIGFGLRVRRQPADVIERRTNELAEMFGIERLLGRAIRTLSGGERQRVALSRALATRPRVLLLDEPLSAVDEQTRESLCIELKRVHHELRTTTIHVSHNFEETLSVADRIGVIHRGRLQQIGPPAEIFRHPTNEFVAGFVRAENILRGYAARNGEGSVLEIDGQRVLSATALDGPAVGVVRPEDLEIHAVPPPRPWLPNTYEGTIEGTLDRGATVKLWIASDPPLRAIVMRSTWLVEELFEGRKVWVRVPPAAVHLFQSDGSARAAGLAGDDRE